jgi:hypothetical protein
VDKRARRLPFASRPTRAGGDPIWACARVPSSLVGVTITELSLSQIHRVRSGESAATVPVGEGPANARHHWLAQANLQLAGEILNAAGAGTTGDVDAWAARAVGWATHRGSSAAQGLGVAALHASFARTVASVELHIAEMSKAQPAPGTSSALAKALTDLRRLANAQAGSPGIAGRSGTAASEPALPPRPSVPPLPAEVSGVHVLERVLEGTPYTAQEVMAARDQPLDNNELLLLARNDALNFSKAVIDALHSGGDDKANSQLMAIWRKDQPAFARQLDQIGNADRTKFAVFLNSVRPSSVGLDRAIYLAEHRSLFTRLASGESLAAVCDALSQAAADGHARVAEIAVTLEDQRQLRLVAYLDEHREPQFAEKLVMQRDAPYQGAYPLAKNAGGQFLYPTQTGPLSRMVPLSGQIARVRFQLFDTTQAEQAVLHASSFNELGAALRVHEDDSRSVQAHVWATSKGGDPVQFDASYHDGQLITSPPQSTKVTAGLSNLRFTLSDVAAQTIEPSARLPVAPSTPVYPFGHLETVKLGTTYQLPLQFLPPDMYPVPTVGGMSTPGVVRYQPKTIEDLARSYYETSGMYERREVLRVNVLGSAGPEQSSDHFQLQLSSRPLATGPGRRIVVAYLDDRGRPLEEQRGAPMIRTADFAQGTRLDRRSYTEISFDLHRVQGGAPQGSLYDDPDFDELAVPGSAPGNAIDRERAKTGTELTVALDKAQGLNQSYTRHRFTVNTKVVAGNHYEVDTGPTYYRPSLSAVLDVTRIVRTSPGWFDRGDNGPANTRWALVATVGVRNLKTKQDAYFQIRVSSEARLIGKPKERLEWLSLDGTPLPLGTTGRPRVVPEGATRDVAIDEFGMDLAVIKFAKVMLAGESQRAPPPTAPVRSMPEIDIDTRGAEHWNQQKADLSAAYELGRWNEADTPTLHSIYEFARNRNRAATIALTGSISSEARLVGAKDTRVPLLANVAGRDVYGNVFHFLILVEPTRTLTRASWNAQFFDMNFSSLPTPGAGPAVKAKSSGFLYPLAGIEFVKLIVKFSIADHPALPK